MFHLPLTCVHLFKTLMACAHSCFKFNETFVRCQWNIVYSFSKPKVRFLSLWAMVLTHLWWLCKYFIHNSSLRLRPLNNANTFSFIILLFCKMSLGIKAMIFSISSSGLLFRLKLPFWWSLIHFPRISLISNPRKLTQGRTALMTSSSKSW